MKLEDDSEWDKIWSNSLKPACTTTILTTSTANVIIIHNTVYCVKTESDQLASRQLLQQGHEDASILDVPEKIMDLDGWVTLRMEGKKEERQY